MKKGRKQTGSSNESEERLKSKGNRDLQRKHADHSKIVEGKPS